MNESLNSFRTPARDTNSSRPEDSSCAEVNTLRNHRSSASDIRCWARLDPRFENLSKNISSVTRLSKHPTDLRSSNSFPKRKLCFALQYSNNIICVWSCKISTCRWSCKAEVSRKQMSGQIISL